MANLAVILSQPSSVSDYTFLWAFAPPWLSQSSVHTMPKLIEVSNPMHVNMDFSISRPQKCQVSEKYSKMASFVILLLHLGPAPLMHAYVVDTGLCMPSDAGSGYGLLALCSIETHRLLSI